MKKRKTLIFSTILLSASIISLAIVELPTKGQLFKLGATNQSYGIEMNASKNKFHSYTGNTAYNGQANIKTDLGNDIGFTYNQVKGVNSTWHVLGDGGYFYNNDPIHGLEAITLTFKTNSASFSIYYSADDSFDNVKSFVSSTAEPIVFNFDNYSPNYFKIVNDSAANFNISSIDITLTCSNNYPYLSLISSNEEMGTVSGEGIKKAGENVTINATPNPGYRFIGWYSGSTFISNNASYSFVIGNDDLSYQAKFTYEQYNFAVQTEDENKGTVLDSSGTYDYLSSISISATNNVGYTFAGWYDGDTLISTNNPYVFNMPNRNTVYTARFSTNAYDLVLTNNNPTLGSIIGDGTYLYNSNIMAIATPNTGVSFLGWYNDEDELISISLEYSFSMPHEEVHLTAKFAWTPYVVEITTINSSLGTITGAGSYTYGQQVNLVATPNEHCSFYGWFDGDTLLSQEDNMTFNMPDKSIYYTAKFVQNHNIYLYSDDENKGTLSGPSEWGAGLEVTVTANAKNGYAFDYWYDDDLNEVSYDSSYTFVMPDNDVVLYGAFATEYTLTLSSSDETKGTVSGGGKYKAGMKIVATATNLSGTFKGWCDSDLNLISRNNPYTFLMPNHDFDLIAIFMSEEEEITYATRPILSEDGKKITYGLYPQTNINDSSLIAELNTLTTSESNGWYLYNEEYYAKVNATPYKDDYTFKNGTSVVSGTTYWFKCEPIVWKVLSNNDGEYYIFSNNLLDTYCFNNSISNRTIGGKTIYPNNYEYSDIRTWLNNDFYNSAFALKNNHIQTVTVDNSASTTISNTNKYACNSTQDKVFLASFKDYINPEYGFSQFTSDSYSRGCAVTDWAIARGAFYDNTTNGYRLPWGCYWTRSPYCKTSYEVNAVSASTRMFQYSTNTVGRGVRPAIKIKIA